MTKPILSYAALHGALIARLKMNDPGFKERSTYVGASEVGACPRLVSFRKALGVPWQPDSEAAGVMLPGKLGEKEGIALLEGIGLDSSILLATGEDQIELSNGALHGHPDGLLCENAFELDSACAYFHPNGTPWIHSELKCFLTGRGILEFKTGSSAVFRDSIRKGLSQQYLDQVCSNMGLSGTTWAMLLFMCRDNYSKLAIFFIPFDPIRFQTIQERADAIIRVGSNGRSILEEAEIKDEDLDEYDSGLQGLLFDHLLEPDPERGYCQKCPLSFNCPAMVKSKDGGEFPEEIRDEVESLACIIKDASRLIKEYEDEKETGKIRLLELSEQYGATHASLPFPYKELKISYKKGRESVSIAKLKEEFPAAALACITQGESFPEIRVSMAKGQ